MNDILLYTILYLSLGIVLALLVTLLLKKDYLIKQYNLSFEGGDIDEFYKLKSRYEKQSLLVFAALVLTLPIIFAYDMIKNVFKLIKYLIFALIGSVKVLYNSVVVLVKKLFKGKK